MLCLFVHSVITALGSGHFGAVSRGFWEVPGGRVDVAIKFLQPGSKEEDKTLFLQEAAIMGQFLHPNIVKLHGVVTVGEPVSVNLRYQVNHKCPRLTHPSLACATSTKNDFFFTAVLL